MRDVSTFSHWAYFVFFFSFFPKVRAYEGVPGLLDAILPDPTLSTAAKMDQAIAALNSAGPFLLIVDNLESVQNEDHTLRDGDLLLFLQKLLANLRGSRVLLTGRYAMQGLLPDGKFAAHVLHLDLDDLSPYETDRLITHHPSLAQLGEEVRQTLIREFGGLPYVYDLLSSEAASQNLDLLLHDMQGRITSEREQRSTEEWNTIRQRVIEFAALGAAVARLSASSRTLLGRLSVLRRPFPLDALVQGLSALRPDWQALLDWSLLRYDPTESTYRLHSLTRRYVQEDHLLTEPERVQTQAQLAAWYEHYASHDSHSLVDYLEAHHLYRASGDVQHAAQLALGLAEVLRRFGLYSLLRQLCAMAVQDMHERDESLMAVALHELGILAYLQGDYPEARRLYQQSLKFLEQLGDLAGQAGSWHQLGMLAQQQGDYPEAGQLYQQSLQLFEQLGDLAGQAGSWHQLGMLAQQQGDYPEAGQLYQQSLQLKEQLDNLAGQANSLGQLGMLAYEQGNFEQALTYMVQAFLLFERLHAPDSALARTIIVSIRAQMDEATFLAHWRALAGNLPVPALPQEPSEEEAPSSMTLEDVLNAVGNALLHGTSEKREQIATSLVGLQQQLPPSKAAVGRFLAYLAATLRGETPDLTSLEAPFTEIWQQFQQSLQTHGSEQDQQEPE